MLPGLVIPRTLVLVDPDYRPTEFHTFTTKYGHEVILYRNPVVVSAVDPSAPMWIIRPPFPTKPARHRFADMFQAGLDAATLRLMSALSPDTSDDSAGASAPQCYVISAALELSGDAQVVDPATLLEIARVVDPDTVYSLADERTLRAVALDLGAYFLQRVRFNIGGFRARLAVPARSATYRRLLALAAERQRQLRLEGFTDDQIDLACRLLPSSSDSFALLDAVEVISSDTTAVP